MGKYLLLLTLMTSPSWALVEVGEPVPNMCWQDFQEKKVCLSDFKGEAVLLAYGAGFCGTCATEAKELVKAWPAYQGRAQFISLPTYGWTTNSMPDTTFLLQWKKRHQMPDDFVLAGSPRDPGKIFYETAAIPNLVVIDKDGVLQFKQIYARVAEALAVVDKITAGP